MLRQRKVRLSTLDGSLRRAVVDTLSQHRIDLSPRAEPPARQAKRAEMGVPTDEETQSHVAFVQRALVEGEISDIDLKPNPGVQIKMGFKLAVGALTNPAPSLSPLELSEHSHGSHRGVLPPASPCTLSAYR